MNRPIGPQGRNSLCQAATGVIKYRHDESHLYVYNNVSFCRGRPMCLPACGTVMIRKESWCESRGRMEKVKTDKQKADSIF